MGTTITTCFILMYYEFNTCRIHQIQRAIVALLLVVYKMDMRRNGPHLVNQLLFLVADFRGLFPGWSYFN